ncbi:DUF6517 family protein [Natronorubrum halophilum]|uniref:DUF6517 family protein n=1 Tax=Natronorubrum halophilum TaxID=1702106 RepID=UPI000EF6C731|nr:DUF6517 family protein [Natronorubrum halophilum]
MNRRTLLGGLGVAGLAGLSGCLGLIGMAEHESSPAGVDANVRSETGYDQTNVDEIVVEEDVGIGPASETIVVTNYLTEHEKAVDMGPLGRQRGAVFMVLTTPKVSLVGRNFNPVEDMSAAELVELIQHNYDDISDISHEEDADVTSLEQTATRSRFRADAVFSGQSLEVDLHVSEAVEAGDDLLVTIGVYPRQLRGQEEANIVALMEGVVTDIETDDAESNDGDTDEDSGNDTEGDDADGSGNDDTDGNDADDNGSDDGGILGALE